MGVVKFLKGLMESHVAKEGKFSSWKCFDDSYGE